MAVDGKENCAHAEPCYVEILRLFRANTNHRDLFVGWFIDLAVGTREGPHDLVPFCMRELRLPEVREAVLRHYEALEAQRLHPRYMNYMSKVNHAYDDAVWELADMYPYFGSRELE
jgi:hypothetical protein